LLARVRCVRGISGGLSMIELLAISASLCIAAAPPPPGPPPRVAATLVPRFKPATPPEGALARFGGNRFTLLRPIQSVQFAADGQELQAWDGRTLYRWEFPSGRPLGRSSVPAPVNPNGRPFAYTALSPRHAQLAWIRFQENKERLQVWDFRGNKLILDRDIT